MNLHDFKKNHRKFEDELAPIFAKYGFSRPSVGGKFFSSGEVNFRVKCADTSVSQRTGMDPKAIDFNTYAVSYGVRPEIKVGTRLRWHDGTVMEVTGFYPKKRKRPVAIREVGTNRDLITTVGSVNGAVMITSSVTPSAASAGAMVDQAWKNLERLACELSPENLCCDGELRGPALIAKKRRLDAQWAAQEQIIGRKVSESEVWNRSMGGR